MRGKWFYILIALLGCALVAYRSVVLDITNDEAYSFKLVDDLLDHFSTSRNLMAGTANTHWLNSFFLFIENFIFGSANWQLRLHSIAAWLVSAYALFHIFYQKDKPLRVWLPFVLVLCNPYLIDFYSLARGYALQMALELLACYYLLAEPGKRPTRLYFILALAVWANYTSLYLLVAIGCIDILSSGWRVLTKTSFYVDRWPVGLVMAWALPNIIFIKYFTGDLEEGLRRGFLRDTIGVFLDRTIPTLEYIPLVALSVLWPMLLLLFFLRNRKRMDAGWKILFQVVFFMVALIHFNFYVLHIPFPFGRTSIFFLIPFLLLTAYALTDLFTHRARILAVMMLLLVILGTGYISYTMHSVYRTVEWWKQQGMQVCLEDLHRQEGENFTQISLAMSVDHVGVYENYYQRVLPFSLPRRVIVYPRLDYSEFSDSMLQQIAGAHYLLLYRPHEKVLSELKQITPRQWYRYYPDMQTDVFTRPNHSH